MGEKEKEKDQGGCRKGSTAHGRSVWNHGTGRQNI